MRTRTMIVAAATFALTSACHHAMPTASLPVPTGLRLGALDSASSDLSRYDRLARNDSIAAKTRADALAAAERERQHDDSVRAQVNGEMGMESGALTHWGLVEHDSMALASRVHFAFDRSLLTPEDVSQLQSKRSILMSHPGLVIRIDGNCDERGSDEYNLALGERRAATAKRWLVSYGIDSSRISIVSYGEERPLDPGHNEKAWGLNRRDGFEVLRLQ